MNTVRALSLVAGAALSAVVSMNAVACDVRSASFDEMVRGNAAALQQDGYAAMLVNFRRDRCEKLIGAKNELEYSNFLPQDESWQGLYNHYRAQGQERLAALKSVYRFNLEKSEIRVAVRR